MFKGFPSFKSTKKSSVDNKQLALLMIILVIGIAAIYYQNVVTSKLEQLKGLDSQIETQLQQLRLKEAEFSKIEENKIQIEKNKVEIEMLKSKIAPYTNKVELIWKLSSVVGIYDSKMESFKWQDVTAVTVGPNKDTVYELPFEIVVEGTYNNITEFIEAIKKAENIYNLKKIKLTTEEVDTKTFVKATLLMSSYSLAKLEQATERELANNYLLYKKAQIRDAFYYNDGATEYEQNTASAKIVDGEKVSKFTVSAGSMYASADNYYIVGPYAFGDKSPILQLNSAKPARMDVVINKTGYTYTLTSATGDKQTQTQTADIQNPYMFITSTIRDIEADKDLKLEVYITNNTKELMEVKVAGISLDRIKVYTGAGGWIKTGETVENIVLRN
jgi:Tfp pilus assembly protein PilO